MMKRKIRKFINGQRIIRYIEQRACMQEMKKPGVLGDFFRAGGRDLLYDFQDLDSTDVVIDAGGYIGEWTERMMVDYGCKSHIYEPLDIYCIGLRQRFGRNSRVAIFQSGLSGSDGRATISMEENASSLFSKTTNGTDIALDGIVKAVERTGGKVGCLKMNIEGAEYDVLDAMETGNLASSIRYVLVQFHDKISDFSNRYNRARAFLESKYDVVWEYGRYWQLWRLKA